RILLAAAARRLRSRPGKKAAGRGWLSQRFQRWLFYCDSSYANIGEVAVNYFQEVGIRAKLEPIERAAFAAAYAGKKYTRGILRGASGAFGNAATRLASFAVAGGSNAMAAIPISTNSTSSRP